MNGEIIILIYSGGGNVLWGVPTRDLTADDIEDCGWTEDDLLASGLYERAGASRPDNTLEVTHGE